MSLGDPIDTDKEGNSLTLMDVMADEDTILDDIDLRLQSERLHRYIGSQLDERERQIIVLRYGLMGLRPLTQREVAQRLDISRSYVSRIEKKAIGTLKKQFARDGQLA